MGVDEAVSQARRRLVGHLSWRDGRATPPGPRDR
jgi:hypothetical protein